MKKINLKKNIQGLQTESGQVPTYYIFVTITHNTYSIAAPGPTLGDEYEKPLPLFTL